MNSRVEDFFENLYEKIENFNKQGENHFLGNKNKKLLVVLFFFLFSPPALYYATNIALFAVISVFASVSFFILSNAFLLNNFRDIMESKNFKILFFSSLPIISILGYFFIDVESSRLISQEVGLDSSFFNVTEKIVFASLSVMYLSFLFYSLSIISLFLLLFMNEKNLSSGVLWSITISIILTVFSIKVFKDMEVGGYLWALLTIAFMIISTSILYQILPKFKMIIMVYFLNSIFIVLIAFILQTPYGIGSSIKNMDTHLNNFCQGEIRSKSGNLLNKNRLFEYSVMLSTNEVLVVREKDDFKGLVGEYEYKMYDCLPEKEKYSILEEQNIKINHNDILRHNVSMISQLDFNAIQEDLQNYLNKEKDEE